MSFLLSMTLSAVTGVSAPAPIPTELTWLTNYEKALAEAKKSNKLVLADFTGSDWCGWCIKLKSEVFDTPEFASWAKKNVVLLELDFPQQKQLDAETTAQNKKLQEKFGIQGFPSILFLDAEGNVVGRTGYVKGGPKEWIKDAEPRMSKAEAWLTSYEEAAKLSKSSGKPILADFTGSDWCGWCIKLKQEVFDTPEFKTWAKDHVVLLEVDFPNKKAQEKSLKEQNLKLQEKYKIQGYPTILILNAKGDVQGQLGYEAGGPKVWLEKAEKALKK